MRDNYRASFLVRANLPPDFAEVDLNQMSIAEAGSILKTVPAVSTYARDRVNVAWQRLGRRMGMPTVTQVWERYHYPLVRTFEPCSSPFCLVPAAGPSHPARIATANDYLLNLRNIETGEVIRSIECDEYIMSVCYVPAIPSQHPPRIVTATNSGTTLDITTWNLENGNRINRFVKNGPEIHSMFSVPNAEPARIVFALNDTAEMLNIDTGETIRIFKGGVDAVCHVPPLQLATASDDHTAKLWNIETGEPLHTFVGHEGALIDVCYVPAVGMTQLECIATVSWDETARLWDIATGAVIQTFGVAVPRQSAYTPNALTAVCYVPAQNASQPARIVTGSMDGTVNLWDPETGKLMFSFRAHMVEIFKMSYIPTAEASHPARIVTSQAGDNTESVGEVKIWQVW